MKLFRRRYKYKNVLDPPENYQTKCIYVIGESNNKWLLSFKCPCGCQDVIHLNLLKTVSPCWHYLTANKKISLYPSVSRIVGCKSHFSISRSKVLWHKNRSFLFW